MNQSPDPLPAIIQWYIQGGVSDSALEEYLKRSSKWRPKRVIPTIDDPNALTGYDTAATKKV